MGIPKLTSKIERFNHRKHKLYRHIELLKYFSQSPYENCSIAIDLYAFYYYILSSRPFLTEFDTYNQISLTKQKIENFLSNWLRNGISIIFFNEGISEFNKKETYYQRRLNELSNIRRTADCCSSHFLHPLISIQLLLDISLLYHFELRNQFFSSLLFNNLFYCFFINYFIISLFNIFII